MVRDDTTGGIVQIRRRVKASAEQIFDLWTKPDLMVRWMSPFPGPVDCKASCDLRPGGSFSLVMSAGEAVRGLRRRPREDGLGLRPGWLHRRSRYGAP